MTRFARARGAAASNERIEEDATPWHIMAQQMRSANGCKTTSNRDVEDLDGGLVTTPEEKQHPNSIEKVVPRTIEEDERSSSDENEYETNDGKIIRSNTVAGIILYIFKSLKSYFKYSIVLF